MSNEDDNETYSTCILYWLFCYSGHDLDIIKSIMALLDLSLTIIQIRHKFLLIFLLLQLGIKLLINVANKLIRKNSGC